MSTRPSVYGTATLESSTIPGRDVDVKLGLLTVDYYESIMDPSISMKIMLADSNDSINDIRTGRKTSIYQGLPLRGKEAFFLKIEKNSPSNVDLDFTKRPLYVRGIKNALLGSKKQAYLIDLISEYSLRNEVNFVGKAFLKQKPSQIAATIIKDNLKADSSYTHIENASNTIGMIGNLEKPYKVLTKLAKKSISETNGSQGRTAGFFFYETKRGIQFRSIDSLVSQPSCAEYVYSEVNVNQADFVSTPDLPSLDFKILSYDIVKNQDVIGDLRTGTYASVRRYFDPLTFQMTEESLGKFTPTNYTKTGGQTPTLGAEALGENIQKTKGSGFNDVRDELDQPSVLLNGYISLGTFDKGVTKELDEDIFDFEAQSLMRYNTLFSQCIEMLVPLNSNLCAGDVISIKIPLSTSSAGNRFDDEVSGKYLIKDLCHHYEPDGSFTKLKIVRDTFGTKRGQ